MPLDVKMKNSYKIVLSVLLVAIFIGCSSTKTNKSSSVVNIENEWKHGVVSAFSISTKYENDSTKATIHYTLAKPNTPLKTLTDSLICSYLDEDVKAPLDSSSLKMYCNRFVQEYVNLLTNDSIDSFPWTLNISLDFSSVDETYMKADFSNEGYTGGAHGSSNFTFYMIDSEQKKVLKLADICKDIPALEKRAEVYFRKVNLIEEGVSLTDRGFWFQDDKFRLNENFYFNSETLTFVYNQYEIAPFSMGIFYLELPLNEISDLISLKKAN